MTHITTLRDLRACIAADTAHSPATEQLAALDAAIVAMEAVPYAQPLFWYRPRSDGFYEGPVHNASIERVRKESGGWVPLFPGVAPQPVADEREAFEAWVAGRVGDAFAARRPDGRYVWDTTEDDWRVWRGAWAAALAAPQPAAPSEQTESVLIDGKTHAVSGAVAAELLRLNLALLDGAQPQPSGNAGQSQSATWNEVRHDLAIFLFGATGKAPGHWIEPLEKATSRGALAAMRAALAAQPSGRERRGSVTLSGTQLLQALDFIAPDRDSDPQQLEGELTIQHGGGHAGDGYYAFLTDYPDEGATLLDGVLPDPADTQPSGQADLAGIAQEIIAASQMPPGERHDVTTDRVASILRRAFGWQAKAVTTPGDNAPAESLGGAPHRIYLVVGDDAEGAAFGDLHEVTWCADRQGPNDVEYVLGGQTQQDAVDSAFEAVRKKLCGLPRYSFLSGSGYSGVRRVADSTGNWIEFSAAHALFDPVAVDAARQGVGSANG